MNNGEKRQKSDIVVGVKVKKLHNFDSDSSGDICSSDDDSDENEENPSSQDESRKSTNFALDLVAQMNKLAEEEESKKSGKVRLGSQ